MAEAPTTQTLLDRMIAERQLSAADAAAFAQARSLRFPKGQAPDGQGADDPTEREVLEWLAREYGVGFLPLDSVDADREVFERQIELGRGAIALEEHLLYGADGETEPAIHAALERRVRLGAWNRLFLRCLEARLGPGHDGLTDAALEWSASRERDLAAAILQMHHRQVKAIGAATGRAITAEERDQSSQLAAVTGYVRQVVESAAHAIRAI